MKNVEWVLNELKEKTSSDYKSAELLDVERQTISGWRARRSFPNNRHVMKICDTTGLSEREVLEAIEFSRERERPMKQAGFIDIGVLSGMSLAGMTALAYEPIMTGLFGLGIVYYVK